MSVKKKLISTGLNALLAFIVAFVTVYTMSRHDRTSQGADKQVQERKNGPIVQEGVKFVNIPVGSNNLPLDFTFAARNTINAVVHVKTRTAGTRSAYDFFYGNRNQPDYDGSIPRGSGVIISSDGYVVTNNHVIENSSQTEVVLNDKRSYPAKLVGTDPTTDIALLKIEADEELPFVPMGNSDAIEIGEWVLAAGNPFNLTSTVTAGIVSAKARNINILSQRYAIESFIQTDAAVNPGNSGGALVNLKGELIGINSAIYTKTGSYVGYSFAVPVNIVKKIVNDLVEFGSIQRAFLGVNIAEIDADLADKLNMERPRGVLLTGVKPDGAAGQAGIKKGDVVLSINNTEVNSTAMLLEQISKYRPGDQVDILVLRDANEQKYSVELQNFSGNTNIVENDKAQLLGATLKPVTEKEKSKLRIEHGVKVEDVGRGRLKQVGVQEGFVITHVNREAVYTVADVHNIINQSTGGVLLEGVYANGMQGYYAFGL